MSAPAQSTWGRRYGAALTGVFGTPQRVLVRGEGAAVWDEDGREYTDLLAGIAVNVLGHAHPVLSAAIAEQAHRLIHVSNFFTTPQQVLLAEELLEIAQAPQGASVFFTNSGTEALEAAVKLARRHGRVHPAPDGGPRGRIIALEGAFHGRTMGALALTAKQAYRADFEPLPGGVQHVERGDLEALAAAMDETVAAVVLEPVQGEAGVHPHPPGYLAGVRALCDRHGALMILDEVQSGMGRTGTWFAWQNEAVTGGDPVRPDAMALAKGLGGGMPVGALVSFSAEVSSLLAPGLHGTTFGGNPLATGAGHAVIEAIRAEGLLERAARIGEVLERGLGTLDCVAEVRAVGAWVGIDLQAPSGAPVPAGGLAPAVVRAGLEAGFLLNATGERTLRLAPPLVVTDRQLDAFVEALPGLVEAALA